jgi:hypothetical protein
LALDPAKALGNLPASLRKELVDEFAKITRNYRENRWEAAELDGGRLCEIVYSILAGHLDGDNYPTSASKPARFDAACKKLEEADKSKYTDSARITIPRVLVGLYDMRNRRGVGHVGGDVSANHMDAEYVRHTAQWLMAELVRLFHALDVSEAAKVVDALVDRTVPVIWEVGAVRRVLDESLSLADSTLLLLYSSIDGETDRQLASNLEQDRLANYRRVLDRLHSGRLVEFDRSSGLVKISPKGSKYVEESVLPKVTL